MLLISYICISSILFKYLVMDTTNKKFPRFISNAPIGDDLFEGQSQKTIATCISDLLLSDESCKVIGIDGKWGSGKSNLVKIVEQNKDIKNTYFTFIYDAWGHQEDLQRRSILEELTEALTSPSANNEEKSVLDGLKWGRKLKSLLAKTREVETKTIPKLGLGVILTGLAVILAPLFSYISDAIFCDWIKIVVAAIPILFLLLYFINRCRVEYKKDKSKGWGLASKQALTNLFLIYQDKQKEDTTYETISEDEPSVKKFRDWMREISEDMGDRRLLLVFDNMDRLPKEKVQELWSSIHTFFAETSYSNIRVIVPFDREHIRQAFSENEDCFGDDFINKTFNVVFRVSLPILSDWKKFFRDKWEEAFHSIDENEFDRVLQIFDLLCANKTPREIVAFINEVISIKLAFKDYLIPDRYIALFIIGKSKLLENPINEIIEPSFLAALNFIYAKDEDFNKYIAALVYQINPETAIQLIYTKTLRDALNNGNIEQVKLISRIPAFPSIISSVIPNIDNHENGIIALNSLPVEVYASSSQMQGVWDDLSLMLSDKESDGQKIKEYQEILLHRVSNTQGYCEKIIRDFAGAKSFAAQDYCKSIDRIIEAVGEKHGIEVLEILPKIDTTVEDFVGFISEVKNGYTKYKVSCPISQVDEYLANLKIEDLETISFVPYLSETNRKKLKKYLASIKSLLADSVADLDEVRILIARYKEIERPLPETLPDSNIYTHFNKTEEDDEFYFDLIAMRLAKQTSFTTSYAKAFDDALNSEEDIHAEELAKVVESYITIDKLLLGLENFKDYPLYVNAAKKITKNSYGVSRAYIPNLIKNFEKICNWGNIQPRVLLQRLNQWGAHSDITAETVKSYVPIYFFQTAISVDSELSNDCIAKANEYLDGLSKEQWIEGFSNVNSYEFRLCNLLNNKLSQPSFDAVKEVLKSIADGTLTVPDKQAWSKLIEKIEKSGKSLTATFNTIRDVFNRQDNMTHQLFLFFGEWLFKHAQLSKKQESLRTILSHAVLDNRECLSIIIQNKDKVKPLITSAGVESVDFIDKIRSLMKDHKSKDFQGFTEYLGIEKKTAKKKSKQKTKDKV